MKRIYYASGSVLTGDRMADAIVAYAAALAIREFSDTIDIPVSLPNGSEARAQLLIGPASQLVVVPEPEAREAAEDEETIAELLSRARALSSPHPQAVDEADSPYYSEGIDYTDATDGSEI
ncbi:MAG: hypothetical protein JWR36_1226 [Glaciihabitans sp.]|jgi:hypothetical protein|nr:hypothetical protein [Glaciihabitans sp.]MDQ1569397.1 hypothetical protein [Actinomycetota bacterium]